MTTATAVDYVVTTRDGVSWTNPDTARFIDALSQLDDPLGDQPAVSLTHHSGWSLTAFPTGRLILLQADQPPRHLRGAARELVAGLWASLAVGDLDTIEAQPWRAFHDAA